MKTENSCAGCVGFSGLLTIVLITLKLCHIVDWSWMWIISPLWIPAMLLLSTLIILLVIVEPYQAAKLRKQIKYATKNNYRITNEVK